MAKPCRQLFNSILGVPVAAGYCAPSYTWWSHAAGSLVPSLGVPVRAGSTIVEVLIVVSPAGS